MGMFISKALQHVFVAFGVVLGGAMLGGIWAILTLQPPSLTMRDIAERLKVWALVVAVGGTIDPIRVIESNFLEGHMSPAIKQILFILSAFIGAHLGTELIKWISKGGAQT